MKSKNIVFFLTLVVLINTNALFAGPGGTVIREVGEFIFGRFGKGVAGKTASEITEATQKVIAKHGDEVLPFLRQSGHAGFSALEEAGERAPEIIKLFAKKGDEAIWIVSKPNKLAIFLKHGDSAADALLKHPNIADDIITKFGDNSIGALNKISRPNAQYLQMVANDGLLSARPRSPELLKVIRMYGNAAMDFIWRNKGALAVGTLLVTFLNDPEVYISGAKSLVVEPLTESLIKPLIVPIGNNTNWNLIIIMGLIIVFLPFIIKTIIKSITLIKSRKKVGLTSEVGEKNEVSIRGE